MPKHKDQRVGVFIDVQNLYYSAKQLYKSKVNFAHILNKAVSKRKLVRAIAYVIKADIKEESNFFEALEKIGYDVRAKDLQTFFGGAKKGDWDVGIAMDIMRMASKLDVVVLVSGDGDFKDLIEHVKSLGCRAEVIGFRKTTSSRLLNVADEFTDLDKELDKVLIREFRRNQNKKYHKPQPVSLLQKVNMDQPEIRAKEQDKPQKEEPKMHEEQQKVKQVRKETKKQKKESIVQKVIKKVSKKKQ